MRGFIVLVLLVLVLGAVATGVIYATSDTTTTSIHFDKNRLDQVEDQAADAAHRTIEKVRDATTPAPAPKPEPTVVPVVPVTPVPVTPEK